MAVDAVPVRTLLGAKAFAPSLLCLRSLVEYSADAVRLVVHEDGTLQEEHREAIRRICPAAQFVSRSAADAAVYELLAKYPHCLAFRRAEVMALKLFDIHLLAPGPVAYCDSDVLFLRPYTGLFAPRHELAWPVFLRDTSHAYAVRPWRLRPFGRFKLVGFLNAGLTLAPTGYLDLDFLEWLLGNLSSDRVFARRRCWTEQTCWAALAARSGARLLDPRQVMVATPTMAGYTKETVAIHSVSTYRGQVFTFASRQRPREETPVTLAIRPAPGVTWAGMLWSDLTRRLLARSRVLR